MGKSETIWVCLACGKTSEDRYGNKNTSHGWDESCILNSVQVKKSHLIYNSDRSRVVGIKDPRRVTNEKTDQG
jgi:hypothetical protein